jgi:hypothetical protein
MPVAVRQAKIIAAFRTTRSRHHLPIFGNLMVEFGGGYSRADKSVNPFFPPLRNLEFAIWL